jgi:GT2 family glycosyltransferase
MTPTVAVVILNYNGIGYLKKFLPSVLKYSDNHTIWVADNASTDNSVKFLQDNFPSVNLLLLTTNNGYAGGYNEALAQIEADYYVLLNSDVEVTPGWISPVIALMEADPQIAACQPKIRSYHQRSHFEYAGAAGGYLDQYGYAFCRGRIFDTLEEDFGQYDADSEVFWATGACLFIKSKAFHALKGFDASFFAHMEEIDLCWRLRSHGYRIMYTGKSVVYHVGGGTLPASNPRKTFLNYRNNLAMLYKNLPANTKWKTIFIRLVLDGISSGKFIMAGKLADVWAIVGAHFSFYAMIPRLESSPSPDTDGLYAGSIIWQYFVKGMKTFKALPHHISFKIPKL